jgi:hypothetical protein
MLNDWDPTGVAPFRSVIWNVESTQMALHVSGNWGPGGLEVEGSWKSNPNENRGTEDVTS